jgi:hypothetical protein
MSARIDNIGIEMDVIGSDGGDTIVSIPSNPGEKEAKSMLADICGECGRADDIFKKNPLLLREFVQALSGAANHLSMIQSDLSPFFRKLDRIIEGHKWP